MDSARSALIKMTLGVLVKTGVEETRLYDAQICYAVDYVRAVAERLVVTPPDAFFSKDDIEAAISTVAEAYDKLIGEETITFQYALPVKPWQSGIWLT